MSRYALIVISFAVLLTVAGCATLRPDFEEPTVTVSTIRALPGETISPQFEIGLHIVNPNRTALKLQGIAYNLKLEGYKILTGVANDLPTIDAYGEGDITLLATTDLFSGIRFLSNLMNTKRESIAYELEAKLDVGGFRPAIRVTEKGEINLSGQTR